MKNRRVMLMSTNQRKTLNLVHVQQVMKFRLLRFHGGLGEKET